MVVGRVREQSVWREGLDSPAIRPTVVIYFQPDFVACRRFGWMRLFPEVTVKGFEGRRLCKTAHFVNWR